MWLSHHLNNELNWLAISWVQFRKLCLDEWSRILDEVAHEGAESMMRYVGLKNMQTLLFVGNSCSEFMAKKIYLGSGVILPVEGLLEKTMFAPL